MKYAYYPGCSLHSTAIEYDRSLRAVCDVLDIELVEPRGWICCGTSGVHVLRRSQAAALALVNLKLVADAGYSEVVVPCAACFSRFRMAQHDCRRDDRTYDEAARLADVPTSGVPGHGEELEVRVLHPLELFLQERQWTTLPQLIKAEPAGIKVACYYGCLLTRPGKVMQFDQCEYPMSMDLILQRVGVETVDWSYKTDCCGGSLMLGAPELALPLVRDIFDNARALGAEALAVACPLCHANLDMRQDQVNRMAGTDFHIPVVYFTQLMGLAFGIPAPKLGLDRHFVDPRPLLVSGGRAGRQGA